MKTASAIDGLGKILDFWASEVKEGWIKMRLKRPDSSGDSEMKSPEKTDALWWLAQNQLPGQGTLATFPEACGSHLGVIFPSRGHLAVFENIPGCRLQWGGVTGIKWVDVRDAPKHLTKYRDPPQALPPPPLPRRNYPAEDVRSKNACMLSHFSHVKLCVTPRTVACQAPLSMGFSRQEYWSGLPCPPPGDLPDLGIERLSLMSPAPAGGFFIISATWEAP